ncbi:type II toxin-antitoxin system VapC family toxin [Dolichospermum circinale CS-1225]|uniref:Ribonuclease VapC n=1 Tax=Dolichospermum circinale CS-537/01 TaxID=3021739 RepID=A0ABT5A8P9_9CYAN|nr:MULTISPECIES: type II toxin-antitoxin system VapC family toxin [Dolichospermum]MBD2445102.1 type II toxin-antitoxin system VapC family toxin [Dolichospermum sp. FACHB-1091]MDB9448751.1 type II toxin-antitoxin system VapC family toxin [Dolichospermum circinale CS-547]MDB9454470.1 type II toxin-antitoxin system VapC family toxin [Dolichospermum circinale CS-541/06]MDB9464478.1 type II toxin-antitoxin system VapC family toxin [Dolichospermum circinale CS-541/04]MDB9466850.1 type II toxin-antit
MIYLLDTNTCIIYLKGKNIHLKEKLDSISISEIAVCSIVKSELFYGAMRSAKPESNLKLQQGFLDKFVSLPFNDEAAIIFGNIRAELTSKGTPIGGYDLQIAAIALANNLILVTHNTREFSRIPQLQLQDWEVT